LALGLRAFEDEADGCHCLGSADEPFGLDIADGIAVNADLRGESAARLNTEDWGDVMGQASDTLGQSQNVGP
jgi:hypothetical protein